MKIKDLLIETPYLHREELPYKALSSISLHRLNQSYTKLAELGDGIEIYQHSNGNIIAGKQVQSDFYLLVSISVRKRAYPVEPTQLSKVLQVSMVNIQKNEEEQGYAKKVYSVLASLFDLVSDHEQYLGAQGLWKSLARSTANVYVFDGRKKDYIRDSTERVVRYNGTNIRDKDIWGTTATHKSILLVATTRDLK